MVSAEVSLTYCAQKSFTPNVYSALKNSSINSDSRTTAGFVSPSHPSSSSFGGKKIIEGIWRSACLTPNENKHFHTWPKRPRNFLHTDFKAHFGFLTRKRRFHQAWFLVWSFLINATLVIYAAANLLFSCFTAFLSCFCKYHEFVILWKQVSGRSETLNPWIKIILRSLYTTYHQYVIRAFACLLFL